MPLPQLGSGAIRIVADPTGFTVGVVTGTQATRVPVRSFDPGAQRSSPENSRVKRSPSSTPDPNCGIATSQEPASDADVHTTVVPSRTVTVAVVVAADGPRTSHATGIVLSPPQIVPCGVVTVSSGVPLATVTDRSAAPAA